MELREYLRIVGNNLWLIVAVTLISLTFSAFFSYEQTPIYESSSTFITGMGTTGDADQQLYLADTVFGRQRIFVTQCDVMKSGKVFEEALIRLGVFDRLSDIASDYTVKCNVMPESNVLLILVEGPSPAMVTGLNQAVGAAGMQEVNEQFGLFPISRLDEVYFEPEPISPNHSFNIVLGAVMGLAISLTIVMLLEYLKTPQNDLQVSAIRDPRFGVYNDRYFENRLMDEINRSRKWHYHITLVMVRLNHNEDFGAYPTDVQNMLIRNAILLLEDQLRESDILGHYEDMTFVILMPQTPGEEAYEIMHRYHEMLRLRSITLESGPSTYFIANTGMVDSSSGRLNSEETMEKALGALEESEDAGENEIRVVRMTNVFFEAGASDEELPQDFLKDATVQPADSSTLMDDNPASSEDIAAGAFDDDFDLPASPSGGTPAFPKSSGAFTPGAFADDDEFNTAGVSSHFLDSLFDESENPGAVAPAPDKEADKPGSKKNILPRRAMPREKKNKPE